MIKEADFNQLKSSYSFLNKLSPKVQEQLQQELLPEEKIEEIYQVTISKQPACLVLSDKRVVAFWMMKLLFVLKMPAQQEFNFSQINRVEKKGDNSMFLHSSVEAEKPGDDYEENTFLFADSSQIDSCISHLTRRATRLS